jgi:hypothetical protein
MSRTRLGPAALVAALTFSAIAASSAPAVAANWFVGGVELAAGATAGLATTAKVDTPILLAIPAAKIKVQCKGGLLGGTSPEIVGTNSGRATALIFEGCETVEPPTKCVLTGQPTNINTEPVKLAVAKGLKAPEDRLTVTPSTKSTFMLLPFSGTNTCAFDAETPVKGAVTMSMPTGESEEAAQALEGVGSLENNSLEAIGFKIFITGRALLKLNSGSKWSFR